MGIYNNNRSVTGIYYRQTPILAVYVGNTQVWPDITVIPSCYAAGYWIDEYPWTDDTPWVD